MAKWVFDPDHCVASFAVRHMELVDVHGQFNGLSGSIERFPDNIAASTVTAEVDSSAVYTGIKKRDEHLMSPEFLDAEKYPKISFKSTSMESSSEDTLRVSGDMTIRGITQPVTMEVKVGGPVKSPFGETSMGFHATLAFDRKDFGLEWNVTLPAGGVMVGSEVRLTLNIEADLKEK